MVIVSVYLLIVIHIEQQNLSEWILQLLRM